MPRSLLFLAGCFADVLDAFDGAVVEVVVVEVVVVEVVVVVVVEFISFLPAFFDALENVQQPLPIACPFPVLWC